MTMMKSAHDIVPFNIIEQINSLGGEPIPAGISRDALKTLLNKRRNAEVPFPESLM